VRDGQQFVAGLALSVHPVPQLLGVVRVQCAEGLLRDVPALAEENVAVQIAIIGRGGPLVRTERRELARMVVLVRNLDVFLPDGTRYLRGHQGLDGRTAKQLQNSQKGACLLLPAVGICHDHALYFRNFAGRGPRSVHLFYHPDVLGVVGYAHPVERSIDGDVITQWMFNRLSLGIMKRVRRSGDLVTENPGIQRPTGVYVFVAEIRVAVRVFLLRKCRCGQRRQGQCHVQSRSPLK
jgi:hypothetical protein